jgi:pyrroloquinoline quinone biosynthesis protein E
MSLAGRDLELLSNWLETGEENEVSVQLKKYGLIGTAPEAMQKNTLRGLIRKCNQGQAPLRSLRLPEMMNIELTTHCPLKCPQCYCNLNTGRDIAKEVALKFIAEAVRLQIPYLNLSGGETLVYPHLTELIREINSQGLCSAIAISGWGFTADKLEELRSAGVDEIYVSLNGSTEEVNSKSRDGFQEALNALQILRKSGFKDYFINWVAREDNIADFPHLVKLAEDLNVKGIYILALKPDAEQQLKSAPSQESFQQLASYLKIRTNPEPVIEVEPCYSPLRAYLQQKLFVNLNTGISKGCGAGRNSFSVDVEGNLTPCRHLLYPEKFASIAEYWEESKVLDQLRQVEDHREEPCKSCYLTKNCLSCRAVADKIYHNIEASDPLCPVGVTCR